MDACLTQACKAAGGCQLRGEDCAGACGARIYRLIVAIRLDAFPTHVCGRIARSTVLESISMRSLFRKHSRAAPLNVA